MQRSSHRIRGYTAVLALVATLALGIAPTALADDGARERLMAARAIEELDPAIRAAMIARTATTETPPPASVVVPAPVVDDGFAWKAAALGLAAGVGAMCVLLGCVTLVRHDGRLRSA